MLYLEVEKKLFKKVKDSFSAEIQNLEGEARSRRTSRGMSVDIGSPIHHRMTPEGMLHEVAKKAGRIQATQNDPMWATNPEALRRTIEEVVDIVNYSLFLGALCSMKFDDLLTHHGESR